MGPCRACRNCVIDFQYQCQQRLNTRLPNLPEAPTPQAGKGQTATPVPAQRQRARPLAPALGHGQMTAQDWRSYDGRKRPTAQAQRPETGGAMQGKKGTAGQRRRHGLRQARLQSDAGQNGADARHQIRGLRWSRRNSNAGEINGSQAQRRLHGLRRPRPGAAEAGERIR